MNVTKIIDGFCPHITPEKWNYLYFANGETKLRSRENKKTSLKLWKGYDGLKYDRRSLESCVLKLYENMVKG